MYRGEKRARNHPVSAPTVRVGRTLTVWGANWVVAGTFLSLIHGVGLSGTFWIYAVICLFAFLIIIGSYNHHLSDSFRSEMRQAKLEGRRLGRAPLQVNRALLLRGRERGLSLNQLAKAHGISKASVCRVLKAEREAVSRGFAASASLSAQNAGVAAPISAT